MRRYILVKDNGDTFVAWADSLTAAFTTRDAPNEHGILAVVTDSWCCLRRGNWLTYAAKHPER